MDPEIVGDIKDAAAMVVDKCLATQNWEVSVKFGKMILARLKYKRGDRSSPSGS